MPLQIPIAPFGAIVDLKRLRQLAQKFAADRLKDKLIRNLDSGLTIRISMQGIKHTLFGAKQNLIHSIAILPEMLTQATRIASEPDKLNRPDVVCIHRFQMALASGDTLLEAVIVVRETRDSQMLYYDHGFLIQ